MRVAVVGHVEWIEFARVERVPAPGEIVHALEVWEEPGGGGAVAAGQMARLAGEAVFFTALGDDALGHRAHDALTELGIRVEAAWRDEPQRRGFVFVDDAGERTITVIGDRSGPSGHDPLSWEQLAEMDAVYFTAGDPAAVRATRAARTMVATPRGLETLVEAGVQLDALVASANDPGERYARGDLRPEPELVVRTAGAGGGEWEREDGETGRYAASPPTGPIADAYGCGDSFAAGLTVGLGQGMEVREALELAARCGAACLTGHGPYAGQLTAAEVGAPFS
ncbi:MAG TPA: PfkB family carbohydrate kinase [Thermoleophilaceae bacterium]|nr:PfkB family carbohydrate kinase [Thermoleophilaceae bacterium]